MDKTPPQLDPKLKEAYDRVMGTVVNPSQRAAAAPPPPPQPAIQTADPTPVRMAPTMTASPTSSPVLQKAVAKKRRISPIILALIIIVFIAVYSVVWVKFLNFKVPFLNP